MALLAWHWCFVYLVAGRASEAWEFAAADNAEEPQKTYEEMVKEQDPNRAFYAACLGEVLFANTRVAEAQPGATGRKPTLVDTPLTKRNKPVKVIKAGHWETRGM